MITDDFSIILLENGTVNKLASWGHVEQESGGVCRKQFDFFFLLIF